VIDEPVPVHFQHTSNVTRCEGHMQRDHELIWTGPVAQFTLAGDPSSVAMREARRAGTSAVIPSIERFFIQHPRGEATVHTFG
jgi:hypothetical protein